MHLVSVRRICWVIAKRPDHAAILLASYPVGIGKADRATPLGRTTFRQAVLDPEWTHPDTGVVYGPFDPDNVLGGFGWDSKREIRDSFVVLAFMAIPARQPKTGWDKRVVEGAYDYGALNSADISRR